jgi:hypothetical protein
MNIDDIINKLLQNKGTMIDTSDILKGREPEMPINLPAAPVMSVSSNEYSQDNVPCIKKNSMDMVSEDEFYANDAEGKLSFMNQKNDNSSSKKNQRTGGNHGLKNKRMLNNILMRKQEHEIANEQTNKKNDNIPADISGFIICGYMIPQNTLFLILFVIFVAIFIFFMTRENNSKRTKNEDRKIEQGEQMENPEKIFIDEEPKEINVEKRIPRSESIPDRKNGETSPSKKKKKKSKKIKSGSD